MSPRNSTVKRGTFCCCSNSGVLEEGRRKKKNLKNPQPSQVSHCRYILEKVYATAINVPAESTVGYLPRAIACVCEGERKGMFVYV